jgi:hypothetical protein
MPYSDHSGDLVTNQDAVAAFNTRYADELPPIGTLLVLPEQNQEFEVIGYRLWRDDAYFVFVAQCMRCGKPYSFEVERGFTGMRRTCLADRGQWFANPKPLYPKQALLEVLEANRLVGDRMLIADAITQAAAKLPVPSSGVDKREDSVVRSLKKWFPVGALGCERDGDYFVF